MLRTRCSAARVQRAVRGKFEYHFSSPTKATNANLQIRLHCRVTRGTFGAFMRLISSRAALRSRTLFPCAHAHTSSRVHTAKHAKGNDVATLYSMISGAPPAAICVYRINGPLALHTFRLLSRTQSRGAAAASSAAAPRQRDAQRSVHKVRAVVPRCTQLCSLWRPSRAAILDFAHRHHIHIEDVFENQFSSSSENEVQWN